MARRPTATERIERYPQVAKKEMFWSRSKPGELAHDFYVSRQRDGTPFSLQAGNERSLVKTHPKGAGAFPSLRDLTEFASAAKGGLRSFHVVSIAQRQKTRKPMVSGLVTLRATEPFVRLVRHPNRFKELLSRVYGRPTSLGKLRKELRTGGARIADDYLAEMSRHGLKMRVMPARGFELRSGMFHPKEARAGPPTATERVEDVPQIGWREMSWVKTKAGELKPNALARFESTVSPKPLQKGERSFIHNHPGAGVTPSRGDVAYFLNNLGNPIENFHIVGVAGDNPSGKAKVVGILTLRATKRLLGLARDKKGLGAVFERSGLPSFPSVKADRKTVDRYLDVLVEHGLKIRATPAPGYYYDDGVFRKKEPRQKERE